MAELFFSICIIILLNGLVSAVYVLNETKEDVYEYGINKGELAFAFSGTFGLFAENAKVIINTPPCQQLTFIQVEIKKSINQGQLAFVSQGSIGALEKITRVPVNPDPKSDILNMHPLKERICDQMFDDPRLQTPPPEPEKPKPPKIRKPRVWKLPPRFPLLTIQFYQLWCSHRKEVFMARHKVDDHPPPLFPELYLKPRKLNSFVVQYNANMYENKSLLKKINFIQRNGGFTDCWTKISVAEKRRIKLMCLARQKRLNEIRRTNVFLYGHLLSARSEQPMTKELNEHWKETKKKLILGAQQPFILFKGDKIDKDIKDEAFDKPPSVQRPRVALKMAVINGPNFGKLLVELFVDVAPRCCQLFLHLVKGDANGYAYTGTRIFRIVPGMYCCGGDVDKDNGYGQYIPEWLDEPMEPENFRLPHSIPGVLSMIVIDNEITGQFNIIFKPLPQFDGKHVVFGRIIAGPASALEQLSAIGLPLGNPAYDVMVTAGWYTPKNHYKKGQPSAIPFPPSQRTLKG